MNLVKQEHIEALLEHYTDIINSTQFYNYDTVLDSINRIQELIKFYDLTVPFSLEASKQEIQILIRYFCEEFGVSNAATMQQKLLNIKDLIKHASN